MTQHKVVPSGHRPRHSRPKNYHLRDLDCSLFDEQEIIPPRFRMHVEECVLPRLSLAGYKLQQKQELAVRAVHSLVANGLVLQAVADPRDKNNPRARLRVSVWDALIAAKQATICVGSESSKRVTRYQATEDLLKGYRGWAVGDLVDLTLRRNSEAEEPTAHALVVLRTGRKDHMTGKMLPKEKQRKILELPKLPTGLLDEIREWEDRVEFVNQLNTSVSWMAFKVDPRTGLRHSFQPNVCLRQIHVGEIGRAVRMYTWGVFSGQNLPVECRKSMMIGNKPTAELDYSGHAFRIAYNRNDKNPQGDIYQPEKILPLTYKKGVLRILLRKFVKRASNICLNTNSRVRASMAIETLINSDEKLKKVVYQKEGTTARGILERLVEIHKDISSYFFCNAGVNIMTCDGMLMLEVLFRLAKDFRPALGMHDAVVCKKSDVKVVRKVMEETYTETFGFPPIVKRKF